MTIKDLAKYCGVSVTTVSYALNDSPEISKETKDKIKKAAKELNYHPNAFAKGLKKSKSNCIGVFIPGFEGPVHSTVLSGIAQTLRNNKVKYNLLVSLAEDMTIATNNLIDLAIIMDGSVDSNKIKSISEILPTVTFDIHVIGENIFPTFISNIESMAEITKLLIRKNCKKIGYLLGSSYSSHNLYRYKGYLRALENENIQFDESIVYDANSFTKESGYSTIKNVLEQSNGKLPFDALMCANDELAIGAMDCLKEYGYEIPKDVKVTGFDNILEGKIYEPSLTTVEVDWRKYGEQMGEFAIKILENKGVLEDNNLLINCKVLERESTE